MAVAQQGRILVVEDDQDVAMLLRMRLEAAGFDVQTVASGAAALTDAAEHPPRLVILDLRLPDISGYDVCRNLRRLCGPWAVPVLMLTGMDQPVDQLRGFAYGADAYLTKPYDAHELLQTIALLLEHAVLP